MSVDLDRARAGAETFMAFCDGMEECGFASFARKGRNVARDLLTLADELEAERSARAALGLQRDEARGLLSAALEGTRGRVQA